MVCNKLIVDDEVKDKRLNSPDVGHYHAWSLDLEVKCSHEFV